MSVTSRTYGDDAIFPELGKVIISGNVSGDKTTITSIKYSSPVTSDTSYVYTLSTAKFNNNSVTIEGKSYKWIIDETIKLSTVIGTQQTVKSAHVDLNNLVINKPIFDIKNVNAPKYYSNIDADVENFSFYDVDSISSAQTEISLSFGGSDVDGKTDLTISIANDGIDSDANISIEYKYAGGQNNIMASTEYFAWTTLSGLHLSNGALSKTVTPPVSLWNNLPKTDMMFFEITVTLYYGTVKHSERVLKLNNLSLPDSAVPTISAVTLNDPAGLVPSSWKAYIQHISKVGISALTADGIYGSTIDKVELALSSSGTSLASASGTTDSLPKTSTINNYGTFDVTVTVTDSRGRAASKSAQVTFLPYTAPYIQSILSQRCLKDGTLDNDGTYVRLSGDPVYSPCNGNNAYHVYVSWKRTDESTYNAETEITSFPAQIGDDDFDTEYSYDIRYRITDQFNTNYFVDYVSTAIMLMHFMRNGKGVAFGQKATIEGTVDFAFNALFRQNVGFEVDGKFYTIEDIINAVNPTSHSSLAWVDSNIKEF